MTSASLFIFILHFIVAFSSFPENYWSIQQMCDTFGTEIIHRKNSTEKRNECPNISSRYPAYLCANLSDFSSKNIDYGLFNGTHLVELLITLNASMTFIGDSISRQMFRTLLCMLESQNASIPAIQKESIQHTLTMFLADIPSPYFVYDNNYNSKYTNNITFLINKNWIDNIIKSPIKNKIVIINTGAWWGPYHIRISDTKHVDINGMMEVYKKHFAPHGPVDKMLHHLHKFNVTVIWRDITPAGVCSIANEAIIDQYKEHQNRFHEMNSIAKKLFLNHTQRYILPFIFESSLPLWRQHLHFHTKSGDHLHWCTYVPNTAPWIWNTILYNFLKNTIFLKL
eukprot:gene7937-16261_t